LDSRVKEIIALSQVDIPLVEDHLKIQLKSSIWTMMSSLQPLNTDRKSGSHEEIPGILNHKRQVSSQCKFVWI